MIKKLLKLLPGIITIGLVLVFLALVVKGQIINHRLVFQYDKNTSVGGPFESSNSTSRYALTEALAEDHRIFLDRDEAAFSLPDLAGKNGKYYSIFTPGVSFLGVPMYLLGNLLRAPQLFTYLTTAVFAILNVYLIYSLSGKLGASRIGSVIAGLVFLFATDALAYSQTFTQHHYAVSVILGTLFFAAKPVSVKNDIFIGLLLGAGLLIDIPNLLMLLPIELFVLFRHFSLIQMDDSYQFKINLRLLALFLGFIPLFGVYCWYNFQTTGQPLIPAQIYGRTKSLDPQLVQEVTISEKRGGFAYNSRSLINGVYILVFSNERGWFYYSPILAVGVLGLALVLKHPRLKNISLLLFSVILVDFISYAMFGDPWGGWSFGPRYLIPATAAACIGVGPALKKYQKKLLFAGLFFVLLIYSIYINTLGVLTTGAVPPKVEAIALSTHIPYTYQYNLQLLQNHFTSSLVYHLLFSGWFSPVIYQLLLVVGLYLFLTAFYVLDYLKYDT